jgi:heptaprenyl diphosphate synthase
VIHLQDFEMKLERVRNQLSNKLFHPYLRQNIAVPAIDEDKVLLLVSLLDQLGLKPDEIDNYAVTTMLLQIALDTHESVQNSVPNEDVSVLKERQLTVLAGTYYSGLFYNQLAGINDIEMITSLAVGVKEINEHKITVYHMDSDAIDKLMDSLKRIESSLINRVVEAFDANEWKEFASNLLFVKRMIHEENCFMESGKSVVFEGLKKLALPKNNQDLAKISEEQQKYLLSICERYIDFSIIKIESAIQKLPTMENIMRERVSEILGQHRSITKIILEEG